MPKVSLCIPTYNGQAYLHEALTSACAQTLTDIEILVVDDGSTDDTITMVEDFARHDPRIRLHRNETQMGLPGNWDRARELAAGDWVAFLFQDDVARPQFAEHMLSTVENLPQSVPIVCCRREFLFDPGTQPNALNAFEQYVEQHSFATYFPGCSFVSANAFSDRLLQASLVNFVGEPTAVMLRSDTLRRFGRFHPAMRQIVDLEYWARVATSTGIAYTDEALVSFRVHAGSATSRNRNATVRMDRLDSLIMLHDMVTSPAYAALRRSPRRLAHLLRLYSIRMHEIRMPAGPQRDAAEPAWTDALAVYPPLQRTTPLERTAQQAYRLWRIARS